MSVLDKLKAALTRFNGAAVVSSEAEARVAEICREAASRRQRVADRIKLTGLPSWDQLKAEDEELQMEVAVFSALGSSFRSGSMTGGEWLDREVRGVIASQLLRRNLPYREEHLAPLIFKSAKQPYLDYGLPLGSILNAAERLCGDERPTGQLKSALEALQRRVATLSRSGATQFLSKTGNRVAAMLDPGQAKTERSVPPGAWGEGLSPWLESQTDKKRQAWTDLLGFAATAGDKARPSKKWLADAKPLVSAVGRQEVASQLSEWLASTRPDPQRIDASLDSLKGLLWATADLDHEAIAPAIGRFAETCFRKVPGVGARSVKLGNACIAALSAMKGSDAGTAELVRLRTRIKYGSVRDLITKRLSELADEAGVSIADLEESALPDFGLDSDSRLEAVFGDAKAIIAVGDEKATLTWQGADGKARKAPPAAVKRDFADELKALKQQVKDIDIAWAVQAARLEAAWVEDRIWPADVWRARYLEHPLRRQISKNLIWRISDGDAPVDVMPSEKGLTTLAGKTVSPGPEATVRLWHPLDASPDDVLAWRRRIMREGLTQPIKQAHREVYVLTDAERTTEIYSNRFAAHILRQHQFRALCQARGWQYEFQGGWDSWNVPSRHVPQHNLTVEYHVDPVENDERSDAYIPLHIATDQVRFVGDSAERINLEDVPPILFSELMRDVDLFVAVSSVANDPDWVDGGPEGRYGTYWREHAFGDLSQTAKTRRDLLAELAPKLAIADKLKVTDKYLEVQGKRHAYRIHLGSSNIQILPDNRYLCIVRGSTPKDRLSVKLPFTGDNLLSIILSKAFMLADDDKITDKTILSQLDR